MINLGQGKVFKIFIAVLAAVAAGILIREIFLTPKTESVVINQAPLNKISIDFNALENPFLTKLSVFETVTLLLDKNEMLKEFGREDPFVAY